MGLTRRELLRGASVALVAGGCGPTARSPIAEEILAFHRASPVFDLHVDTLAWMRGLGYDVGARHENRLPGSPWGWHFDLPRAEEAGLDGAALGIPINPVRVEPELRWDLRLLARIDSGRGFEQTRELLDEIGVRALDRQANAGVRPIGRISTQMA